MANTSFYAYDPQLISQFLSETPREEYPHRMIQFMEDDQVVATFYAEPNVRHPDSDYFSLHTLINMLFEEHPDWSHAHIYQVDQEDRRKNFTRFPFTNRVSEDSTASDTAEV